MHGKIDYTIEIPMIYFIDYRRQTIGMHWRVIYSLKIHYRVVGRTRKYFLTLSYVRRLNTGKGGLFVKAMKYAIPESVLKMLKHAQYL